MRDSLKMAQTIVYNKEETDNAIQLHVANENLERSLRSKWTEQLSSFHVTLICIKMAVEVIMF